MTKYNATRTYSSLCGRMFSSKWEAERAEQERMLAEYGPSQPRDTDTSADPMASAWDGHRQMFLEMIAAIREDRQPRNSGESALHAVEIITSMYESCRLGRPVKVNPKYA